MTSPRQRKKRLAALKRKEQLEKTNKVAQAAPAVVESVPDAPKPKKILTKNALVETKTTEQSKSQDQVIEQPKQEVKTSTGE